MLTSRAAYYLQGKHTGLSPARVEGQSPKKWLKWGSAPRISNLAFISYTSVTKEFTLALKPFPTCRFPVRALLSWSMTYQAQLIRKRSCKEWNDQYLKHCCFGWFRIKGSHHYSTNQWFYLRKHFEISMQSGEQSLIINHEKSTTLKQDALKLPKIKT